MTPRQRALAQPQGRARKKPGTTGTGNFYRIEVRPKSQFTSFRVQDVGGPGGLERVAGRRSSGSWATAAWLVSKTYAHARGKTLVADVKEARDLFKTLGSKPELVKGDIFKARPRPNVPEYAKPTPAQKRAQRQNIKKAHAARKKAKG